MADCDAFRPSAVRIYPGLRLGLPAFHWKYNGKSGWASTRGDCIGQAMRAHEQAEAEAALEKEARRG